MAILYEYQTQTIVYTVYHFYTPTKKMLSIITK
jgi:hypothetical protein